MSARPRSGDSSAAPGVLRCPRWGVSRTFLHIRIVHVLSGDGQTADLHRVHCPAQARDVALEQCLSCADSGGIVRDPVSRFEYASCRNAGAIAEASREEPGSMERTPLSAVMTTDVFAVRPDVSLEALTGAFLEKGISGAPVVDGEGRPVGVISKTDLVGARPPGASVASAMTASPCTMRESEPLCEAAALLAGRGIHRVLVVSDDDRLSGIVADSDIVRWVAERGGRLPARPRA